MSKFLTERIEIEQSDGGYVCVFCKKGIKFGKYFLRTHGPSGRYHGCTNICRTCLQVIQGYLKRGGENYDRKSSV